MGHPADKPVAFRSTKAECGSLQKIYYNAVRWRGNRLIRRFL